MLAPLSLRSHTARATDVVTEANKVRTLEGEVEFLKNGLDSSLAQVEDLKRQIKALTASKGEAERELAAARGDKEAHQRALDKVGSLTQVTLDQTAEIFRLNELVIQMDSEMVVLEQKLRRKEMEENIEMQSFLGADGGGNVAVQKDRDNPLNPQGVWVPMM